MVMLSPEDIQQQILIVEDDEDTAEVVCTLLQDAGYQAIAVDRGDLALSEISSLTPDLVLLDINLPDMNGIEIVKNVRAHSFLPVIVLSGYGKDRDRVIALEAGADDYMAKPFSPEELVARVRALLRRVDWTPKPETHLTIRQLENEKTRRNGKKNGKRKKKKKKEKGRIEKKKRREGEDKKKEE